MGFQYPSLMKGMEVGQGWASKEATERAGDGRIVLMPTDDGNWQVEEMSFRMRFVAAAQAWALGCIESMDDDMKTRGWGNNRS
jgi:hypothetical protein